MRKAILALADGTTFEGEAFGAPVEAIGEVVFNTSMTGYQEILTDPSYVGQIVCMTAPEMGNVGVNLEDEESKKPHAVGMIVRENKAPSSWRATDSLDGYLAKHRLAGISGIDTRRLVRHIRTTGAQMGVVSSESVSAKALVDRARAAPGMEGRDLATETSCKQAYDFTEHTPDVLGDRTFGPSLSRPRNMGLGGDSLRPLDKLKGDLGANAVPLTRRVVAVDYGLKKAMLRLIVDEGCRVTVVPAWTSAADILAMKPNGVFLTNGPGDPAAVKGADKVVAELLGKLPVFGICLGHQIMGLAMGAKTYKLKFGHRGGNQPVKDLLTGRVEITAQNHGFAVDDKSLKGAKVSYTNLNDGTVEGIEIDGAPAFSVQFHPEASPGPHDSRHLFARFAKMMDERR